MSSEGFGFGDEVPERPGQEVFEEPVFEIARLESYHYVADGVVDMACQWQQMLGTQFTPKDVNRLLDINETYKTDYCNYLTYKLRGKGTRQNSDEKAALIYRAIAVLSVQRTDQLNKVLWPDSLWHRLGGMVMERLGRKNPQPGNAAGRINHRDQLSQSWRGSLRAAWEQHQGDPDASENQVL
ncbi:MAG TPA: hypothetical protein VK963_03280, partial [Candidatus Saccharimonadales bacterium]|nr:hypothetical protein [Candidatus Saccharimonadales bacterium]